MCTVCSFIWMYAECSRRTPACRQAIITRPEQSNVFGPAAPKTYGLPSCAYAYASTAPTRPLTFGRGGGLRGGDACLLLLLALELVLLFLQRDDLRLDPRLARGEVVLLRGLLGDQPVEPGLLALQRRPGGGQRGDVALPPAGEDVEGVEPIEQLARTARAQHGADLAHGGAPVGLGRQRADRRRRTVHLRGECGDARRDLGELGLGPAELDAALVVLLHDDAELAALLFDLFGEAAQGGVSVCGGWGEDRGHHRGQGRDECREDGATQPREGTGCQGENSFFRLPAGGHRPATAYRVS